MRRLALLVALVVLAVACHSSDPIFTSTGARVHVMQTSSATLERQIHVIVPAKYMTDAVFAHAMRHAVAQGDRSPYIDMVLETPAAAPAECLDRHCIIVYRAPMNGGVAGFGWDPYGHMYGRYAQIGFDSAPWDQATLDNAACHEIAGHAVGLGHSSHGTQGPCIGTLTTWDLRLIAENHNHRDTTIYGPAITAQLEAKHGKAKMHIHRHDRGFYEALSHRPS